MYPVAHVSRTLPLLLALLIIGLPMPSLAQSTSSTSKAIFSDAFVIKATVWADRGPTNQDTACELAKVRAADALGGELHTLGAITRFGTDTFPSHYVCQWDPERQAYRLTMTVELPRPPSLGLTASDRQY